VASIVLCCAVLGVLLWPPSRFEGGTSASTDSTIVRLPVDNGAPRRVPDVRGMTLIDARRELERAGFVIESLEHMTYPDPSRHNRVDSQLPLAGDTARAGSGVTLTIAQLPTAGQKTAQ
jgi:beta-lactam-binding protein with PASTA domain